MWISFIASIAFTGLLLIVEIYVAVEPVLPPYLLSQKVPVLVGCSNALVAVCNLSVTYYFPTWFQTVMLTSASTAGKINIIVEFLIVVFDLFFLFDNRTSSVTEFYLHFDWLFFCWVSCGDSSFSVTYLTEDVFLV